MDPIELGLAVIEAVAKLTPVMEAALPALRTVFTGGAPTASDIAALEAARDALNVMAQDAEQKVIDGGGANIPLA